MTLIRFLSTAALASLLIIATAQDASARTLVPYEEAKIQEAMSGGKGVLVEVYADWCPACKKGHSALEKALNEVPQVAAFQIDFDKDGGLLKRYGVEEQGTFLIIKDGKEVARLVGASDADVILDWIKSRAL